jgi:hypothetical protein
MLKDLRRSKVLFIAFAVVLPAGIFITKVTTNQLFILLSGPLLLLLVLSSVITHERAEDKYNGYTFLQVLPLKVFEIVGVKFLLMLLISAAASFLILLLIPLIFETPIKTAEASGIILLIGNFCLLVVALIYLGIYALGFVKFANVAKISVFAFLLIPQVILFVTFKSRAGFDLKAITLFFINTNWLAVTGCSVLLYFILMLAAIRFKRRG